MKIAIITTVNHNVGDDFVREGIKYLLRKYFKNETIEFQNIHKHCPITVKNGFEWVRNLRLSNLFDKIIPLGLFGDKILNADLIVQSGAPVYWCHENTHCYNNEWYKPLIERRFKKNKNGKLLNLAAGTCQTFHSDGSNFCKDCNEYIRNFYNLSNVTTLRDTLAEKVLKKIAINAPVIPCSSIFAIDEHNLEQQSREYVVMNYMKGGAHYTFGQKINFEKWKNDFKTFYFWLKEREKVIISCHSQIEVDAILEIDKNADIFYKKDDYIEYMKFYSKAKFGFMNRVHGAFLIASFGRPSIAIGNDSRVRMCSEIGIKNYFVNDIDFEILKKEYETLKVNANEFEEKFKLIKDIAFNDYMEALSKL